MRLAISLARVSVVAGSIVVLATAGSIILASNSHHTAPSATPKTAKTTMAKTSANNTSAPLTTNRPTNVTTSNTSNADKQTNAATNNQSVTDACSLLTLSVARQLLGTGASSSTPSDTSSLQANATNVSSCAYTSGGKSVQLGVRKPTSTVGASENDVAFGSAKPASAVTVQGYGQSAYWDPNNDTLNVLGDNNWYIISRSSNTQADAEAAADLLKSGF
jgi:hypothetical protein